MATYENRSRFVVQGKKTRPDLYKEFPYDEECAAKAYFDQLDKGLSPTIGQLENKILARVRTKGFKPQQITADSWEKAEGYAAKIEEEHSRGLFIDYTKSHNVTQAKLIEEYIKKECTQHKGEDIEICKYRAMLEDSTGELKRKLAQDAARNDDDPKVWANGRHRPKRHPMENLEWLHKPFALIESTDIEGVIRDRLEVVAPGTVDRELDLISSVINVAINTWRYTLPINPILGVRRPKYFNERNTLFVANQEPQLLDSAREEDRIRSRKLEIERLMTSCREEAFALTSKAARKAHIADGYKLAELQANKGEYVHVHLYETLIRFLIATAARRGEALNLLHEHVNYDEHTAFLPETKNGRSRTLPLMTEIIQALRKLFREGDRVFPISLDSLKNAWARNCQRAGIEDLHVHDLRHIAISRVADTGLFSLIELQAYSGHLDIRSLLRYAHLCAKKLAKRLDEALGQKAMTYVHKGQTRLKKGAGVFMGQLARDTGQNDRALELMRMALAELENGVPEAPQAGSGQECTSAADALPDNVVQFVPRLRKQAS